MYSFGDSFDVGLDHPMKLHHVGIIVASIERAGREYRQLLGLEQRGEVIEDPLQQVKVQFWACAGDTFEIELIEPCGPDSPAYAALQRGGGMNHLCYEVSDIVASLEQARRDGAVQTRDILPAAAFGGRRIAFVYYHHLGLIEFVESSR